MYRNYEVNFESDSESGEEYADSIVTTSGGTSESLLSAPTLYTDSDVSVKVPSQFYSSLPLLSLTL